MNAIAPRLRAQADALSRAISAGDEAAVHQCLTALTPLAEGQLCATLAAVVANLHRDLDSLPRGAALACADLPDARNRLQRVVQLTQEAANQTLDCIEASQHIAETLSHHGDEAVRHQAAELRAAMRDAAAAQAYQDVAGQMLGQVTGVLTRLRGALDSLLTDAGLPPVAPETGPVLPGAANAASQGDADQLLADLGL
ncbi:MAG TPA: protein phosphatase CheZ [Nevskiaceae bacterium]|nr:protein phosphatase CheZ [Nevskiaceae bacterium]